jgi:hypothetical protein
MGAKVARTGVLNLSTPLTLMYIYVSFRLPVRNCTFEGFAFSAQAAEGLFFFETRDSRG